MRVPDLDWPADLFSDVIEVPAEKNAIVPTSTRPGLWADMVRVWTSNEPPWPVKIFTSPQLAW